LLRAFILKASEGRTAPDFSLKSLAGSPGRMDLISRCIIAAFNTPRGMRKDTLLEIVLEGMPNPPVSMTLDGNELGKTPMGEVEVATIIHDALSGKEIEGIILRRKSFQESVRQYVNDGFALFYLHEAGKDSRGAKYAEKSAFVLGDHKGLDPASERFLDAVGAERVSLGPHSYLASHCITMVNCELDIVNR
jgi:tRNA (pseudouridine54-N1)-methyltransferase